jgi:hypothetical protein
MRDCLTETTPVEFRFYQLDTLPRGARGLMVQSLATGHQETLNRAV